MAYTDLGRPPASVGNTQDVEPGVSVIVCCHNSAARLPETLAHLGCQKGARDVRWEVLVIDNASTDGTAQIAQQVWPKECSAPLRVITEPQVGKVHALSRALSEARYEFVGIIDDDNWVCEDWVETAYLQMLARPDVGILGSSSSPVFEVAPPSWFHQVEIMYAITPRTWEAGDFTRDPGSIWGAGMVVRKSAWLGVLECDCPQLLLGRLKNSMAGGEDNELCYQLRLAGWKLWFEPRLHFQHFLPASRLSWEYVRRLIYGGGEAGASFRLYGLSLDRLDNKQEALYKYSWFWSLLTAVRQLLRHPLVLLAAALFPKEGDQGALTLAELCGRIATLMQLRATYKSHLLEIQGFSARVRGQAAKTESPTAAAYATGELSRR